MGVLGWGVSQARAVPQIMVPVGGFLTQAETRLKSTADGFWEQYPQNPKPLYTAAAPLDPRAQLVPAVHDGTADVVEHRDKP